MESFSPIILLTFHKTVANIYMEIPKQMRGKITMKMKKVAFSQY
jgi:hypothetical protein